MFVCRRLLTTNAHFIARRVQQQTTPTNCLRFRFQARVTRTMATQRQTINTADAPSAVGPYVQAVKAGNTIYCSGQIGFDPKTMEFVSNDVAEQAEQVMKNLGAVLKEGGASFDNVVKTTVLLTDMADFPKVNAVYEKYFPGALPARACYAAQGLPKGALVEIEAIAVL